MNGPVVVDLDGFAPTDAERARLAHPLTGMVILFARNFASAPQLAGLCEEIHALRPELLIAVDHEGGRVQRFRGAPFTRLPPMAMLGRSWDRDVLGACRAAVSTGYVLASELRAHGVDLTFAPVLDLDHGRSAVIGDRALHRDPRVVAMLANHLCHGLALAGMACCGKHFPGHGWAQADSHVDLPVDERTEAQILAEDAAPYAWLAPSLAGVMPAHVVYPEVGARPAGFSAVWLKEILRSRLGFTGAIFSDDLMMAGAKAIGDIAARGRAALDAGCDFVLVCNDPAATDQLLGALAWQPGPAFGERVERLRPKGRALSMKELAASAMYRAVLADLEALVRI